MTITQIDKNAESRADFVLLMIPFATPHRDLITMTLAWMCREAGVLFETYFAADHEQGGLFSRHGSTVIGGHHAARISRALATFRTVVIRTSDCVVFDSLIRSGAHRVIDMQDTLTGNYGDVIAMLGLAMPREIVAFDTGDFPPAVYFPECTHRRALAVPLNAGAREMAALRAAGAERVWTIASHADTEAWRRAGFQVEPALNLAADDPQAACVKKYLHDADAVDLYEPVVASYMLAACIRLNRLMFCYDNWDEADRRKKTILRLMADKKADALYGRWFGDAPLRELAAVPLAYNVVEPHRNILSFDAHPESLPQPQQSWADLEPSDEQLHVWAAEGKILASWVLHSGELSHDDSVLAFQDWAAMTRGHIGSGVHWQRYHCDPDAVELMHVPVEQGGVLGLVEPVLHSAGCGIMWETAGDAEKIAALMAQSRQKMAQICGTRFAPRGVYCFGDQYAQPAGAEPGMAQLALWRAVKKAGFDYLITSALPGASRVLYRDGDFVVLNQAGKNFEFSPFVRGSPATFAAVEREWVKQNRPGWLIGAVDTPIHGCPIYVGRPYGDERKHPRISDFFDYLEQRGATGRVISATPHTIARYARMIATSE